jgi:hypothetical protein
MTYVSYLPNKLCSSDLELAGLRSPSFASIGRRHGETCSVTPFKHVLCTTGVIVSRRHDPTSRKGGFFVRRRPQRKRIRIDGLQNFRISEEWVKYQEKDEAAVVKEAKT